MRMMGEKMDSSFRKYKTRIERREEFIYCMKEISGVVDCKGDKVSPPYLERLYNIYEQAENSAGCEGVAANRMIITKGGFLQKETNPAILVVGEKDNSEMLQKMIADRYQVYPVISRRSSEEFNQDGKIKKLEHVTFEVFLRGSAEDSEVVNCLYDYMFDDVRERFPCGRVVMWRKLPEVEEFSSKSGPCISLRMRIGMLEE